MAALVLGLTWVRLMLCGTCKVSHMQEAAKLLCDDNISLTVRCALDGASGKCEVCAWLCKELRT